MRGVRVGAIGARPAGFNTVRYSEKLLERLGIAVETLDLSEVFTRIKCCVMTIFVWMRSAAC
jgi:L-fucose isomerase-like protein